MTDVVVRKCRVRVARRGGWGWGVDRRALAERVVHVLGELLERKLADWDGGAGDWEITEPVKLSIGISQRELIGRCLLSPHREGHAANRPMSFSANVVDDIDRQLRALMEKAQQERSSPKSNEVAVPNSTPINRQPSSDSQLEEFFLRLQAEGQLGVFLSALPVSVLDAWSATLLGEQPLNSAGSVAASLAVRHESDETDSRSELDAEVLRFIQEIAAKMPASSPTHAQQLVRRLTIAVETLVRFRDSRSRSQIRFAIDAVVPLANMSAVSIGPLSTHQSTTGEPSPTVTFVPISAPPELRSPGSVEHTAAKPAFAKLSPAIRPDDERVISSALPFLLLSPLHQLDCLSAWGAAFDGAGQLESLPVLATALAHKVLSPLQRGWRRNSADAVTAATFAARESTISEEQVNELADRCELLIAPIARHLTLQLFRQRSPQGPVILWSPGPEADGRVVLVDRQGLIPLAWNIEEQSAIEWLSMFPPSAALIGDFAATPEFLRRLHAAAVPFVMTAPPIRGESWRRIRRRGHSYWTNAAPGDSGHLTREAGQLPALSDLMQRLWQELHVSRQAAPLARHAEFESSLTLMSAVALGVMARTLWSDQEATDPLLALERFSDLDGRVRIRDDRIHVQLPLGRRSQDLSDHGFLADLTGVPWLGDRTLTFGKG